VYARKNSL